MFPTRFIPLCFIPLQTLCSCHHRAILHTAFAHNRCSLTHCHIPILHSVFALNHCGLTNCHVPILYTAFALNHCGLTLAHCHMPNCQLGCEARTTLGSTI